MTTNNNTYQLYTSDDEQKYTLQSNSTIYRNNNTNNINTKIYEKRELINNIQNDIDITNENLNLEKWISDIDSNEISDSNSDSNSNSNSESESDTDTDSYKNKKQCDYMYDSNIDSGVDSDSILGSESSSNSNSGSVKVSRKKIKKCNPFEQLLNFNLKINEKRRRREEEIRKLRSRTKPIYQKHQYMHYPFYSKNTQNSKKYTLTEEEL